MAPNDLLLGRSLLSRDEQDVLCNLATSLLLASGCLRHLILPDETTVALAKLAGLPCAPTEDFMQRIKVFPSFSVFRCLEPIHLVRAGQ